MVEEATIESFCGACDFKGSVCEKVGERDQARYASRGWCGWAQVKGVKGQMTNNGFKA